MKKLDLRAPEAAKRGAWSGEKLEIFEEEVYYFRTID